MLTDADDNYSTAATRSTTDRRTFVATPMATDYRGRTGTQSPVIIMSEEFNPVEQSGVWDGGRMRHALADGDQSSCLPLLVVPGMTPRSSIMSEEFNPVEQSGVWDGGRMRHALADGDQSSCLPLLVVPGMTPRSSTSSQSCLSVPGFADINGYITSLRVAYLNATQKCPATVKSKLSVVFIRMQNTSEEFRSYS